MFRANCTSGKSTQWGEAPGAVSIDQDAERQHCHGIAGDLIGFRIGPFLTLTLNALESEKPHDLKAWW